MTIEQALSNLMGSPIGLLALFAFGGVLIAIAFIIALQITNPEFNPIKRAMSEYVNGRHGRLMIAALIVSGLSFLALAGAFHFTASSFQQQIGVILLALGALSLLISGAFPVDDTPDGSFHTTSGVIHAVAGFWLSPLLAAGILCLSGPLNRAGDHPILQQIAVGLSIVIAVAFGALLFVNLVARSSIGGLGQRIFMGLISCWVLVMALRLILISEAQPLSQAPAQ